MAAAFYFQWENITVTITEKRFRCFNVVENRKNILDNVSGYGNSNSLIALFGPSGCGKTTLLGALSGRLVGKKGVLKINNKPVTNKYIRGISGYIHQEDKFTECLTVLEHMQFMSALKLRTMNAERREKIRKLLTDLSLEEKMHDNLATLSGGERRKLALATELINDPHLLFCDEPTTGLDSFSALSIVQKLEAVSMTGKLVLVSVHQPSSQLFDLFNHVILLANGKLIFQGSKTETKIFFESASLYCPVSFNPADFYMRCLSVDPSNEGKGEDQINRLRELFVRNYLEKRDARNGWKNDVLMTPHFREKKENVPTARLACLERDQNLEKEFEKVFHGIHNAYVFYFQLTSLVLSVSFANVTLSDSASVQNIQGVLLLIVSELIYTHMYMVVYVFPDEMHIFLQEKNVYSSFPYFLSKLFLLIPGCLINSLSFLVIYFAMLPFLKGLGLFLGMAIVLFCTSLCGTCIGLSLSGVFSSIEYMELFIVPFDLILMILSGIWIKIDTIPKILSFLKYLSPFYFGFRSVSTLFWERVDQLENCTSEHVLPCYEDGKDVLTRYGFFEEYDGVLFNVFCMCALMFGYCYIGYLGIIRRRALYELY